VADDEPALLTAITRQLTQAQRRVRSFKSRDERLAAVDQEVPDLILYDIKTPEETGLETLAICKNIIEAHHGDIYLASAGGVSTTVSVSLLRLHNARLYTKPS
jgi:CheY-like chemotaxis protein